MCAACPTQDVSALYTDTFGGSRLSKSTVSRVTQQLTQEFESWRQRDLKDLRVVYLFLDGQYHAARQGTDEKEGVLSAYALLDDGQPVLLHLDLGPRESYDAWLSFLQDLVARGLRAPLPLLGRRPVHRKVTRSADFVSSFTFAPGCVR